LAQFTDVGAYQRARTCSKSVDNEEKFYGLGEGRAKGRHSGSSWADPMLKKENGARALV